MTRPCPELSGSFFKIGVFALCAFILCATASITAQAQSTDENVAIAFFKTANTKPDFEKLATGTREYRLTPVARQSAFVQTEKLRLAKVFQDYDLKTQLLTISSPVFVALTAGTSKEGEPAYAMTLSFPQGDVEFFPFQYQDYSIAVIPQNLATHFHQAIPPSQYELMLATFKGKPEGTANLLVELRPEKAYADRPYDIGGKEQWGLLTNVAGLTLSAKDGVRLWNYSAPWYISPVTEDLRDMYDSSAQQKQREMELENPILAAPKAVLSQ